MGRMFGTDGVRGIANTELTNELAYNLGRAGAYVLTKETSHAPTILVGMDTRISGDMLESSLVAGICSVGATALVAGVVPTPAVAYLIKKYNADAGVVISASHNPVEYNGIKFFNKDGFKLKDEIEDEIEDIIKNSLDKLPYPTGEDVGMKKVAETAIDDYVDFLISTADKTLEGINLVIDCANGASYQAAPLAYFGLKANVTVIHNEPDGKNINKNCGSTHIAELKKKVVETKADIGLAFDGDADRCLAVDENGELIDGDKILSICGINLKEKGLLKNNAIVGTVMSNLGFDEMGRNNDINIVRTKVGDRYVLEEMLDKGYVIGGEQSGHVIFLEHNTTGDGILTGIQLLCVLKESGKKASELAKLMNVYPQVLVNAKVNNDKKQKYLENEDVKNEIERISKKFDNEGRVLIRPSGTEPLIRVMIEGKDIASITEEAEKLAKLIEEKLK